MRAWLMVFALAQMSTATVVDRVAIAIGYQVITAAQIDEELRVTALLNHQPVARTANARRDAADRLVQQFLIRRETEVAHYPPPSSADADAYVAQIEHALGGGASLARSLAEYDVDRGALRNHLILQLATLRFIEFRFRPESYADPADAERRTDEALNIWLEEARKRVSIIYLDKALQ
jgi:hypothetical protein